MSDKTSSSGSGRSRDKTSSSGSGRSRDKTKTQLRDVRADAPAAPPAQRPTWVEIDLGAITANVRALRKIAAGSQFMAVVKADGYGHGLLPVTRAALAGGADWLGVALVEEGRMLRDAGVTVPILLLTEPPIPAVPALLDAGLTPAVYSPSFIEALDAEARRRGDRVVDVHCKLDTGMRRVGVPQSDWPAVMDLLVACSGVRVTGLWSHFACADEPGHPSVAHQSRTFAEGVQVARDRGLAPDLLHLCNSAATLTRPGDHHDLVRCGIALYGLDPGNGVIGDVPVRPALRWVSQVSLVKRLAAGEAVSYGHVWRSEHDTTVGTVPAGYADGVARRLGGRGEVVVGGRRRPMVGRVCMDQFVFAAGDDEIAVGDQVVLIGTEGRAAVTADDWAAWLGTINYEIVCTVGQRVPRVYQGAGATSGSSAGGSDVDRVAPPTAGAHARGRTVGDRG